MVPQTPQIPRPAPRDARAVLTRFLLVACWGGLLGSAVAVPVHAATSYYIAPGTDGNDSANGLTPNGAWKTFAFALPQLAPGDTLYLLNGTYTKADNGFPDIFCGTSIKHGTSAQKRITLKALHERQARIQGDGSDAALHMTGCRFWSIEGLVLLSADKPATRPISRETYASPAYVVDTDDTIFRRNIFANNNRYNNTHCATDLRGERNLWEENELYWCHRHGLALTNTTGSIVRRNYFHSRNYADLPNCDRGDGVPKCSGIPTKGDAAITCYPCRNAVIENNVTEGWGISADIQATHNASNNKYYGHISLHDDYGLLWKARDDNGNSLNTMPRDIFVKDTVVIGNRYPALWYRGTKNARCDNCSFINAIGSGLEMDVEGTRVGDGSPSGFATNLLVVGANARGIRVNTSQIPTWSVNGAMLFDNTSGYSPALTDGHYSNISQSNPALGTCLVVIPDGSPAKGAGVGGADIGANVINRYQDAVLTSTPLWDPTTNRFPCGAIAPGINDLAGSSCMDVHLRLNINSNGCTVPLGPPTYYIATTGDDTTGTGSSDAPWQTFDKGLARLQPGATLVVKNGTYTGSNMLHANCTTTETTGTPTAPITVRAESPRGVFLQGDGTLDPIRIEHCSYWRLDGFYAAHSMAGSLTAGQSGSTVYLHTSDDITLANLLVTSPRFSVANADALNSIGGNRLTVEDTEIYAFHRFGLKMQGTGTRSTVDNRVRRVMIHSRSQDDAGAATTDPTRGDAGLVCYSCVGAIFENVAIEDVERGIELVVVKPLRNVQILGSMIRAVATGVRLNANGAYGEVGVNQMVQDTTLRDVSVVGATTAAYHFSSVKNVTCLQCSALTGPGTGILADTNVTSPGDGAPTLMLTMPLLVGMSGAAFNINTTAYTTWSMTTPWIFTSGTPTPAVTDAHITGARLTDPSLTNCLVGIPLSSPAATGGLDGDHVGAHIWYTSLNGTLTQTALWNPGFPCGATVAGVNDNTAVSLDASCGEVHTRFNVNTGECLLGRALPLLALPW